MEDFESFRQHYSTLSDAALLNISRDDLVESARLCYDAELASRGLKPRTPKSNARAEANEEEAAINENLVSVGEFASWAEADVARGLLESDGIPCSLPGEHRVYAKAGSGYAYMGLQLMVPAAFAERARTLLAAPVSEDELEAEAEAATPPEDEPGGDSEEL